MLQVLQHLLKIDAGLKLDGLKPLSDLVTEISKAKPARNKAIVGDGLFEVESGIVVHLVEALKDGPLKSALFPFMPEHTGHQSYEIIFGRGTGVRSVKRLLSERDIDATDEQIERITNRVKDTALLIKNGLPISMINRLLDEELN